MNDITTVLMQLIKSEVCRTALEVSLSDNMLSDLYTLSKAHDLAHLVGNALDRYQLLSNNGIGTAFRQHVFSSVYRYERLNYSYEEICVALEQAAIDFLPLKGAVVRNMYPEPWLRTSCDIDILVRKEELNTAASVLTERMGYTIKSRSPHDISFVSPNGIVIELHFELIEDKFANEANQVLRSVWEHSHSAERGSHHYEMDDAMFYFYHIAHMAKHFEEGGCGIRPFIDLWLMEDKKAYWNKETIRLLRQGELYIFAQSVRELSKVWFSGKNHSSITEAMESFILNGGVYGTLENQFSVRQKRLGGKWSYVCSRVFIPYNELSCQYPILKEHPLLTPIYELCRLYALMFGRKKNLRTQCINKIQTITDEQATKTAKLLKDIGLE